MLPLPTSSDQEEGTSDCIPEIDELLEALDKEFSSLVNRNYTINTALKVGLFLISAVLAFNLVKDIYLSQPGTTRSILGDLIDDKCVNATEPLTNKTKDEICDLESKHQLNVTTVSGSSRCGSLVYDLMTSCTNNLVVDLVTLFATLGFFAGLLKQMICPSTTCIPSDPSLGFIEKKNATLAKQITATFAHRPDLKLFSLNSETTLSEIRSQLLILSDNDTRMAGRP